mmetsp:Transcript_1379/g.4166  ORF Transcript_1379/g.4166 Transcript_1379/m.4166 type:complete len:278 (-) Transcript_1379:511-1344(-)
MAAGRDLDHLGRQVVPGAAEGPPRLAGGQLGAPAEVGELRDAALAEQDVLGLHVAVHGAGEVQVVQGARDAREDAGSLALRQPGAPLEGLEERALARVLEEQVHALRVFETLEESNHVWVLELELRAGLPEHVGLHVEVHELGLRDHLHRKRLGGPSVGDLLHGAEGPSPDGPRGDKVAQREAGRARRPINGERADGRGNVCGRAAGPRRPHSGSSRRAASRDRGARGFCREVVGCTQLLAHRFICSRRGLRQPGRWQQVLLVLLGHAAEPDVRIQW